MAIVNVYRIRDGAQSSEGEQDGQVYRYKVETDDPTHEPDICWTSGSIPAVDSLVIRPGRSTLIVKDRQAEHDSKSPFFFIVTVNCEERQATGGEDEDNSRWDVSISIDGMPFEEPLLMDVETSKAIVNSAGQAFDPPLTETFYDEKISLSFKTNQVNQATIPTLRGKVNQNAVTMNVNGYVRTFAANTLWLASARQSTIARPASAGVLRDPDWQEEYELVYRADTWDRRPVDMGYYEKISGELVQIKDKYGEPLSTPSFLNGSGSKLSPGASAVRLTFKGKKKANFAPLFVGF